MRRLTLLTAILAACTSGHDGPEPAAIVQMNDLSVLLPLASTSADFAAYLAMSAPGPHGPLVPQALYEQVGAGADYLQLRAVAFRLDPCFGHLGPIAATDTCDNQIRIVFQPLVFTGSTTTTDDVGVHVSYSITRDELLDAVREIAAARAVAKPNADLGPLAPNAIVASEGMTGPMATALADVISKHADGTKIERITTFTILEVLGGDDGDGGIVPGTGSDDGSGMTTGSGSDGDGSGSNMDGSGSGIGSDCTGEEQGVGCGSGSGGGGGSGVPGPGPFGFWQMNGIDVANGVADQILIPTLNRTSSESIQSTATSPLEVTFDATTSADDESLLASATNAQAATMAKRQAAFDAALRVENPMKNSPNTIDCASCHMAEPSRLLVGQMMLGMSAAGDANGFVADASIPAADLVTSTPLVDADQGLNIHAFSYRGTNPMINQRVVNETAANVAFIATQLAP